MHLVFIAAPHCLAEIHPAASRAWLTQIQMTCFYGAMDPFQMNGEGIQKAQGRTTNCNKKYSVKYCSIMFDVIL
ncbi:hypothetical protein THAOC_32648 [Thalassiosira oceanica]|uniref:Uncharacterized protein n=1 Tax=Thalassiosira oceanica TaxID=159749 RepID=K0R5J1_THAOC|nr:hypothetical protein THAOC_32648 [Thalassiosira oceanica]|eukprot:EJK48548.1 hypothetical protein THAOC_32648 [Thalassiosira oceanica]